MRLPLTQLMKAQLDPTFPHPSSLLVRFVGDGLDNADNSLSTDGNVMFIENKTKGGASKIQEDGISVGDETKMECTHQVPSSAFQDEVILNEQDQRTENGVNGLSPGCKAEFQQNRGVRRRCLIFEVAAISKINQKKSSEFPSPYFLAKSTSDDQQKVSSKTSKVQVPCILPGIGLHLNALASSSLDKVISEKSRVPGIEISSRPSISKFYSENPGEKHSEIPVALQQHQVPNERKIQNCHFDASQTHAPLNTESNSPKKKKRKTEIGGENEGCKRCHCKKSKCLKLYCECFAAGVYCVEPCSCQGCLNKPNHEDTVLATRKQIESRNPLAFAPKVIVSFEHDVEMGEESNKTPASARHKRGCNCKKSNCLKKYCECFQGGVGCSFSCRCEGCKNAFGMKFGSEENEEDKELDVCNIESSKSDDVTKSNNVQKKERSHISSDTVAIMPFHACSAKPPRTCALLQSCRTKNPRTTCKKDTNNMELSQEDAIPTIASHSSPCTAVKTASPQGKRVSLP
ncbi:hypothetical protein HPP92_028014 [Vanilla planifolia]|uniref:CRC domain-containing protein n=1 Tax=Vanilla planifolia TaxID=51239 RepID=A0A835P8Y8_VANPL|nr:hypothetical protein HPP92_028014 [Vanilla planifolia]